MPVEDAELTGLVGIVGHGRSHVAILLKIQVPTLVKAATTLPGPDVLTVVQLLSVYVECLAGAFGQQVSTFSQTPWYSLQVLRSMTKGLGNGSPDVINVVHLSSL